MLKSKKGLSPLTATGYIPAQDSALIPCDAESSARGAYPSIQRGFHLAQMVPYATSIIERDSTENPVLLEETKAIQMGARFQIELGGNRGDKTALPKSPNRASAPEDEDSASFRLT